MNSYEILIGHNNWNASKIAGILTFPAIIKEGLTEETSEMYIIKSNLMQCGFDNLCISEQAVVSDITNLIKIERIGSTTN
ncbi:MAG: hypothetical protein K2K91_06405 [Ruminococcus sp.]|nr:hypothetical protein [Ruminococcus sp.]